MPKKIKLSRISALHYFKLVFRSVLFLCALAVYIVNRVHKKTYFFGYAEHRSIILTVIGIIFFVEMILRFFPSRMESMGCQKQFSKNYIPRAGASVPKGVHSSVLYVLLAWLLLNGAIGVVYFLGWIDAGILFLISLAYSVCDMICILFFCPFQTWFMKNKCCGSCRIYNWDYAMMFTPLVFVPGVYTYSLLGVALLLVAVWEFLAWRHPERFSEQTNECLSCKNCQEKLCHHKSQLRGFLRKNKEKLLLKGNVVIEKVKNVTKKK